ncbi:MAG: hypothetical protein ABIJ34_08625 [archaeon]
MPQSMMSTNPNQNPIQGQNPYPGNMKPAADPGMLAKKLSTKQIIAVALLVLGIILIAVAVLTW